MKMEENQEVKQNLKKRLKSVRHNADYKRNVVPKCKVKEFEHINYGNKTVPAENIATVSYR